MTPRSTIWCSNQLSYASNAYQPKSAIRGLRGSAMHTSRHKSVSNSIAVLRPLLLQMERPSSSFGHSGGLAKKKGNSTLIDFRNDE